MGVRSALASTLSKAAGALAGPSPQAMREAAQDASQMTMDNRFAPGEPIGPYSGYNQYPRSQDYVTGYNIATRPRTHERVSFETLRGLIEAYDFASICIYHRIDSLRSLDWQLVAMDGFAGDVTDAIAVGMKALAKPDRENSFEAWFAKWIYDVLAFDAGALYRMRDRAGRVVGLQPIDGTLLAPLLDYWGNRPKPPAEAFVQYVNGLPWNWLTSEDIIYEPFRPRTNSPYGHAPLESIILNANTDIRFQLYFLQRFTTGNVPAAFASAPEGWSPDQIEAFQAFWDSLMYGDQTRKSQLRWIPGGSKIAWSDEKEFSDKFSLFMMRKTGAAYHVVPADMGFTEDVNRSSGDSQADVQHRVGDLPLGHFAERVLTSYIQNDLGLPLKHQFDWGEEQDDRYAQAQADQLYIDRAVVSASEIREMRYGLAEPVGQAVPRVFFTNRQGPIPLSSLYSVAGPVDPHTAAPEPGTPLPREVFAGVPGTLPELPVHLPSLSETKYGADGMPEKPPDQPPFEAGAAVAPGTPDVEPGVVPGEPVAKEGAPAAPGGPTTGVTADTGIYSYDLAGRHHRSAGEPDEDEEARAEIVKAELAAFRRFERARRRSGAWRDFRFSAVPPVQAHRLNDAGRAVVRKEAGELVAAGLAVLAADTGRVLMLQRALDGDDPAGGKLEFPGGHLADGETPITAAAREWCEETGCILPFNPDAMAALAFGNGNGWTSSNGVYAGFVYPVPSEDCVPVRSAAQVTNPDDPDGDQVEAILWVDPADLPGNPIVRDELATDLDAVMEALGALVPAGGE